MSVFASSRLVWMSALLLLALGGMAAASYIEEEYPNPPPARAPDLVRPIPPTPIYRQPLHVPELADYLDRIELRGSVTCGRLAVFPIRLHGAEPLNGRWLTMSTALSRGILVVTEKGGGAVPVVWMENRSREEQVLILAGEVISGGKQTRTVRQDVVLAPGQAVDIGVFCVEAHRWQGDVSFKAAEAMAPSSIQNQIRGGADQAKVWSEVARNNQALGTENATGSLDEGMKAPAVQRQLDEVRRVILPDVPHASVGYIFVDRLRGRAVGAEFFGRSDLAQAYLSRLIDAYAVDMVVGQKDDERRYAELPGITAARVFLQQIRQAGSSRSGTPGSGVGIEMNGQGLVGTGVGLWGSLVHFAAQSQADIVVPMPRPTPPMPPRPRGIE